VSDGGVAGVDLSEHAGAGHFLGSGGTGLRVEASSQGAQPALSNNRLHDELRHGAAAVILSGKSHEVGGLGVHATHDPVFAASIASGGLGLVVVG